MPSTILLPFVLGKCQCGCNEDIEIKYDNNNFLKRFKLGHHCKRENHYLWQGGRRISWNGYIMIHKPEHPYCNNSGYVREHRLVMEEHLGRYLTEDEFVHHINENKQDNRIENLHLTTNQEHRKLHIVDMTNWKCSVCKGDASNLNSIGRPKWYNLDGNKICNKCYMKLWRKSVRSTKQNKEEKK